MRLHTFHTSPAPIADLALFRASFSETEAQMMSWSGRRRVACIFRQSGLRYMCFQRRIYRDIDVASGH